MAVGGGLKQPATKPSMGSFAEPTDTKQYDAEEIRDLLILRNAMKQDERATVILGQQDIDKLFE
jgi:hypothetical protein